MPTRVSSKSGVRVPKYVVPAAREPSSIRRLLRRCLQKDVHDRLPDIGVACLEVKDAQTEPEIAVGVAIGRKGERFLWLAAASSSVP